MKAPENTTKRTNYLKSYESTRKPAKNETIL
jgi:hypothetical protein